MGEIVDQGRQHHRADQALLQQRTETLQAWRQVRRSEAPASRQHPQQRLQQGLAEIGQQPPEQGLTADAGVEQGVLEGLIETDQGQRVLPVSPERQRFVQGFQA